MTKEFETHKIAAGCLALESLNAQDMIEELADDLEKIGHNGKSICHWFINEAIKRGQKDAFMNIASDLRLRASAIKEQVLVVDAVRSRPFCNESIH